MVGEKRSAGSCWNRVVPRVGSGRCVGCGLVNSCHISPLSPDRWAARCQARQLSLGGAGWA